MTDALRGRKGQRVEFPIAVPRSDENAEAARNKYGIEDFPMLGEIGGRTLQDGKPSFESLILIESPFVRHMRRTDRAMREKCARHRFMVCIGVMSMERL